MVKEQAYYKEGYVKEIADTHAWRNVSNCAEHLIPLIKPDFKILDVGSGPGTITIDFGNYVPEGHVTGVEPTIELIERSRQTLKEIEESTGKKITNVTFEEGSIYKLPFEDNSFDLIHAHQVVVHLEDPIAALKELRRVTKVGGFVCVKDGDLKSTVVYPEKFAEVLGRFAVSKAKNSTSTDIIAGRSLRAKAIKAGYKPELIKSSASIWCLADKNTKELWSRGMKARLAKSKEKLVVDDDEADKAKRAEAENAWNEFVEDDNGFLTMQNGQIVYTKE
ncbi:S-adenosyl-L-methionine-dependent methyltransferase [Scheffersomyces coipomensis]|uniref:S-adenosyl-L-methionine-dependent methyltransferase n=1 Tax=Scheffersomyces coipomensis TaxID=1788519 RepID=UPI00315D3E3D